MNAVTALNTRPSSNDTRDGRLHVLQVIGNAIVGGMESWVERLIARLPRERFRFTALCPFESPYTDRLRALDIDVFIAPMPDDPPWSTVQMAHAIVAHNGVDLLHAHLPKAHLLAGIAGGLAGKPVLATVHGRQLTTLDLEAQRACGSHVSVVCQQSYYHALGVGVPASHLSCETNGVDTTVFKPLTPGGAGLRAALGLVDDTPLVGFVGRLSPEKGPEVFVRATLLLRNKCPDAHCVVIGEGPMEAELRELIEQFGLTDRLHLLGMRQDMPAVYNELDLLVSSSHSEAMPLAVMEAMACGVPAVAARVGGVPDIVEHGQSGWLVAPGDFDDIANRCAWLLGEAALRRRMGAHARQRAVLRFELGASVERVGDLMWRLGRKPAPATARGRMAQIVSQSPQEAREGAATLVPALPQELPKALPPPVARVAAAAKPASPGALGRNGTLRPG